MREAPEEVIVPADVPAPSWRRDMPLLALLADRRQFLGRVFMLAVVVSVLVAFLTPKQYKSTVQLMPPDPQSGSAMSLALMAGGLSNGGLSSLASSLLGKTPGQTFIGILQSRTVADDLIDHFDLRKVYWKKRYSDAREKLAKRTQIEEDRKSGIISITVTDNDPVRARDMANRYVVELDALVAELSISSARREREFLEKRLAIVKADLDDASVQLSKFSSKNATLEPGAQGRAMVEATTMLQGQLIAAQTELEGMQQIYAENSVHIKSAKARVEELRRELKKLGGTTDQTANLSPDQSYPSLRQLPLIGVKYADLYRRMRIEETVYEILTKQYELAKVQEAKEIPTIKVLDPANIPEKKSYPPRAVFIAFGTFMAMLLACAWVVFESWWGTLDETRHPLRSLATEVDDWRKRHMYKMKKV